MKGLDHPRVPSMIGYNVINIKKVALCVVIEHKSGSLDKVTLQVPLRLIFYMYDP